jgi:myo-inositol-1(or 4)-monophosphatase
MKSKAILDDYLTVCERAARAGGSAIQSWVGKFTVRNKGPADLVTQADVASQEAIRDVVLGEFPDHILLGEEDDPSKLVENDSEYRWIADPLDGTTNFVHGVPHYCVSLALEYRGELLVAAVYNPVNDECFTAIAGHGAWLNGHPLRTSGVTELSEALAVMGLPPQVKPDSPDLLVFLEAIYCCQGIRRTGSAALNLCYLAAGRYDFFWTFATKIWDVAAGVLLLREAGGNLCTPEGDPYRLSSGPFLAAANSQLLSQVRKIVQKAISPK